MECTGTKIDGISSFSNTSSSQKNSLHAFILLLRFCVHIEDVLDQLQSQLHKLDENDENYQSLYVDRFSFLILIVFLIQEFLAQSISD